MAVALGARAPERVLVLDALPRNANGKVMRGELVTLALRQPGETAP
jgi:acyl-coenzyme A synthetase/AMP-(fatty) acid ligase